MDTAQQIFEYLPLKYKNPSDTEYFDFLKNSVEQNCDAENYHFGVAALHMIYMGIVYHYIYGIFRAGIANEVNSQCKVFLVSERTFKLPQFAKEWRNDDRKVE